MTLAKCPNNQATEVGSTSTPVICLYEKSNNQNLININGSRILWSKNWRILVDFWTNWHLLNAEGRLKDLGGIYFQGDRIQLLTVLWWHYWEWQWDDPVRDCVKYVTASLDNTVYQFWTWWTDARQSWNEQDIDIFEGAPNLIKLRKRCLLNSKASCQNKIQTLIYLDGHRKYKQSKLIESSSALNLLSVLKMNW